MDNDLISRAAIIREIERIRKSTKTLTGIDFLWMIETFPPVDAAPVVRCKDCKNWDSSTEGRYVGGWCFCEKLQFSTSPDWFCADGERTDAKMDGGDDNA